MLKVISGVQRNKAQDGERFAILKKMLGEGPKEMRESTMSTSRESVFQVEGTASEKYEYGIYDG